MTFLRRGTLGMKAKMRALQNVVLFFGKSQPDGKNSSYIRQIQLLKVRAIYYIFHTFAQQCTLAPGEFQWLTPEEA